MKIAEVYWQDITEYTDKLVEAKNPDPMIHLISVGFLAGKFKDKFGVEYVKLCHKKCQDSGSNDDFLVIPMGCIEKIVYHK